MVLIVAILFWTAFFGVTTAAVMDVKLGAVLASMTRFFQTVFFSVGGTVLL